MFARVNFGPLVTVTCPFILLLNNNHNVLGLGVGSAVLRKWGVVVALGDSTSFSSIADVS